MSITEARRIIRQYGYTSTGRTNRQIIELALKLQAKAPPLYASARIEELERRMIMEVAR